MFHNFLFLQSDVVFGIVNAFSCIVVAVSSEKSCPTSMFFVTYTESRTIKFFLPAEFSDSSIQISGAAAVCKETQTKSHQN